MKRFLLILSLLVISYIGKSQICETYDHIDSLYKKSQVYHTYDVKDTMINLKLYKSYIVESEYMKTYYLFNDDLCYLYISIAPCDFMDYQAAIKELNNKYIRDGYGWVGSNGERVDLIFISRKKRWLLTITK